MARCREVIQRIHQRLFAFMPLTNLHLTHFPYICIFSYENIIFYLRPFFSGISVGRKTRPWYLAADSEIGHCKVDPTSLLNNGVATLAYCHFTAIQPVLRTVSVSMTKHFIFTVLPKTLTVRYALSITAFCIRIFRVGRRFKQFSLKLL
jgi:hypothetical protein